MGFGPLRTAPKYQNEAVVHRLIPSGRVGTTATLNKRSRDTTLLLTGLLINGSLIVIIILGNGLILATIFCCGKLHVAGLPYITSLSGADLFLGALGVPLQMYNMITQGPTEFYSCLVFFLTSVVFSQVSVLCLVAVTWDRFLAVVFPLKHKFIMTTRKVYTLIAMSWIFGIIIGNCMAYVSGRNQNM